jgi:NaMN:DMB phosphoribosyltransferase
MVIRKSNTGFAEEFKPNIGLGERITNGTTIALVVRQAMVQRHSVGFVAR